MYAMYQTMTPQAFFDERRARGDYERLFVNKGWKSRPATRGYVSDHNDQGVFLRDTFRERNEPTRFVPYVEIMTVHRGQENLIDVFVRSLWKGEWKTGVGWLQVYGDTDE